MTFSTQKLTVQEFSLLNENVKQDYLLVKSPKNLFSPYPDARRVVEGLNLVPSISLYRPTHIISNNWDYLIFCIPTKVNNLTGLLQNYDLLSVTDQAFCHPKVHSNMPSPPPKLFSINLFFSAHLISILPPPCLFSNNFIFIFLQ